MWKTLSHFIERSGIQNIPRGKREFVCEGQTKERCSSFQLCIISRLSRKISFNKANNRNLRAVTNLTVIRLHTFEMLQFNNRSEGTYLAEHFSSGTHSNYLWLSGIEFKTALVSDTEFLISSSLLQADTGNREWGFQNYRNRQQYTQGFPLTTTQLRQMNRVFLWKVTYSKITSSNSELFKIKN